MPSSFKNWNNWLLDCLWSSFHSQVAFPLLLLDHRHFSARIRRSFESEMGLSPIFVVQSHRSAFVLSLLFLGMLNSCVHICCSLLAETFWALSPFDYNVQIHDRNLMRHAYSLIWCCGCNWVLRLSQMLWFGWQFIGFAIATLSHTESAPFLESLA